MSGVHRHREELIEKIQEKDTGASKTFAQVDRVHHEWMIETIKQQNVEIKQQQNQLIKYEKAISNHNDDLFVHGSYRANQILQKALEQPHESD